MHPVMFMRRALRSLHAYLAFYLGLIALGMLCLCWTPFALLLGWVLPEEQANALGGWVISYCFRGYLFWLQFLGVCRFDLKALDVLAGEGALILAPNHPCLLDAVMVVSRLPRAVCIMKAALMNNLFLGAGARLAGYIRNHSMRLMAHAAIAALNADRQLLMFPEGTRTTHDPVNAFMGGVGLIACHAGVPVQTLFIETDSGFLGKGWSLFKRPPMPVCYSIRLGRRFPPGDNAKALMSELEAYFRDVSFLHPLRPSTLAAEKS